MNLRFLDAFLWIVRLGSFRAAADRLHVSQAAISSRIATLEEDLGRKLFDRQSRTLRLTPAGQALISYAERMLDLQQDLRSSLAPQTEITGPVRIGVVETVVHTILVNVLDALHSAHPGVAFEVTAEPTLNLHEHLKRGLIDLALHSLPVRIPDISNALLCELPMGWVCRRSAEKAVPSGLFGDLVGQPIITFPSGSQPYEAVVDAFKSAGEALPILHSITSIAAIMRLVHAGMGIASMPLAAIREELASNLVSIVGAEVALPPLPLFVSFRTDPPNRMIDQVVAVVRQQSDRLCDQAGPSFARRID